MKNNTVNSQSKKVAICVISYDGASELWDPFFDYLENAWPECKFPKYLVTNFKSFENREDVKTVAIGEDKNWSSNMRIAINAIPESHILFMFDDWLLRSVQHDDVLKHIDFAISNDLPYLTLHPNNYRKGEYLPGIRRISRWGIYRCTLVYGLFRKDIILSLLKDGENAWEFEIESGVRARDIPLFSVDKPVFRYYHLLRKGKWMQPGFSELSKRYPIDSGRPVETNGQFVIREIKEWLFRKYHRFTPPWLTERLETRRQKRTAQVPKKN